ncbi:MAG: hypothetical protein ACLQVI_36810 [Polyangiaceae bacterium]
MDDAGIPALQDAIRHMYGLEATWLESVPVHEVFRGATVWQGEVQVFAVEHAQTKRVYAWSHVTTGTKRRFHAVLGVPPIDSPLLAVRASIVGEAKRAEN